MQIGTIYWDYKDGDDECHYQAKITDCVVTPERIRLEFIELGGEPEFSGSCDLSPANDQYLGHGQWVSEGESHQAVVALRIFEPEAGMISMEGTWHDEGDDAPYELGIEISAPVARSVTCAPQGAWDT